MRFQILPPGGPWENGCEIFYNPADARTLIENWRRAAVPRSGSGYQALALRDQEIIKRLAGFKAFLDTSWLPAATRPSQFGVFRMAVLGRIDLALLR